MTDLRVGLVADDLTGAADAAVPFAEAGWTAHLLRGRDPAPASVGPTLLAVATGVRAAPDDVAAARTAAAVRELAARGCTRLYVKVDSTVRGSVEGQVRGALAGWSPTHPGATVVLCPAFPAHGRTVVGGEVRVDGVPVAATAAGSDPVTPVRDSDLGRLAAAHVTVADAATDADLDALAARLDRLGPAGVGAGSAGLAAALARRWSRGPRRAGPAPAARVLVGVSSRHPDALRWLRSGAVVPVVTTPTAPADPAAVAAEFGERVAAQLAAAAYDVVVLVGGDGAAAALDRLGATAVTLHADLAPGVPIGAIVGGAAHGVRVVTTSGGFAGHLPHVLDRLRKEPA